ncbi:MAG: cohesin domain-containing protein [Candidatus Bathyarchaeota archaeon]|nr:cohesin domain-containing protein [Candidatus Bathyarchaeota archaeon]
MKLQIEKGTSLALTLLLLASFVAIGIPNARAQATTLALVPSPQDAYTVGELVTFSCLVSDVTDLYGFGVSIAWNTTELAYNSHVLTVPVTTYPGGVLNPSVAVVKDAVDIPAGTYEAAATSLSPALGFDGTGTIFNITFQVVYIPYDYEIPGPWKDSLVQFTKDDLADSAAVGIPHTTTDGLVRLNARPVIIPPEPLLKVYLNGFETYQAGAVGEEFPADVMLMGDGLTDLDTFWDVAGIDVYMHYNDTMLEALDVTLDPTGDFASFFGLGIFEIAKNITPGLIHVAFIGFGEPHFPPYGVIKMFTVNFRALTESESFPTPSSMVYLENPTTFAGAAIFDSMGGLIDIANPVGTFWFKLIPNHGVNVPFEATSWDDNGDGVLSPSDQIILEGADGLYFDYHIDDITGTLNLTQLPFQTQDADLLAMDGPTNAYTPWPKLWYTGASFSPLGNPYMSGNFSLTYPVVSVNYFEVNPQVGSSYNLTEGADFIVNPDGTIDLLHDLDVRIENEFVGTMPDVDLGWPAIAYIASGFESVWIDMPNGTSRYARALGNYAPPPNEYWYDDWFPYEIESYWATGYYAGPWVWPDGTDIYINYTAASFVTIDYNAPPDPNPRYIEFNGTYADFLAALPDPTGSTWDEAYPFSLNDYEIIGWDDNDASTDLTPGDVIYTDGNEGLINYVVNEINTDIQTSRKQWICEDDPAHDYFGWAPIVDVAGWPHPERGMCPYDFRQGSIPLPHVVENAVYSEPYKPSGGFIDIYTQYPDPFGGQGYNQPSDMFWPQKEMIVHADVSYATWPEQNKDVAFQVLDPHGQTWGIYVNRTNTVGHTFVRVRLPWPCDDPEYYFGVWTVIATVDVACVVVNDTMEFKYDYKVHIWDVSLDKAEYKHCEDIVVTIDYGTWATQEYNITFAITAVDASGVPFDFAYAVETIGWGDHTKWCMYANGTVVLTVHVEKFARPPLGTIYVVAMSDLPANGGGAETPVFAVQFTILPEWAI